MSLVGEQVLMRAYLHSADRAPYTPSYELLLKAARKAHLAGATVLRGILGVSARRMLRPSAVSVVEHAPVIVEIVDTPAKIAEFMEKQVREIVRDGMITLERAAVVMYRNRREDKPDMLKLGQVLAPLSTLPRIELGDAMKTNETGVLLRVFHGESDKFEGKPLHEAIVQKVRELGLAGATVLRGTEGFGAKSVVHKSSLLDMSSDLPLVIEIVDSEGKINALLPHLELMVREGMITMEHVKILVYRA